MAASRSDSDGRAPVIVGVGELVRRPGEHAPEACEPALMTAEAVTAAVRDAGAGDALLRRVQAVAVAPPAAHGDGDPGRRVCELLGIGARTLRSSRQGGNGPQLMVNELSWRIAAGQLDVAVVCGAEALHTAARAMKQGEALPWPAADPELRADEVLEGESPPSTDEERAVGVIAPIMAYPLIENALRRAAGRSAEQHLDRIAALWSAFSEVAARHPCAWTPEAHAAASLREASPGNRRVTFPYLKLMNANIQVDQAAALVLCSAGAARSLGVPRDRWVFVHAGAQATDEWFLSHRRDLDRSPAIAACGRDALGHAGCAADELAHVDLYSCFPSAVQLAARELGLPLDDPARPPTCTGGLTFFGGPGNNYATHGIAAVARRLREGEPGERGLATALGWYATKHALGIYGNAPPAAAYAAFDSRPEPVAPREVAPAADQEATAETCTVVYERDGSPSYGILFALRDDGRRVLGQTRDAAVMEAMTTDTFLGGRVRLRPDRTFAPEVA
jgi:acetyl-CoA C-acetyltransferase